MGRGSRWHLAVALGALLSGACSATTPRADASAPESGASADATADSAPRRRERCNGVDDDGDGKVDEGCPLRLTQGAGEVTEASLEGARVLYNRGGRTWLQALPPVRGPVEQPFYCGWPSLSGDRVACAETRQLLVRDLRTGDVRTVVLQDARGPTSVTLRRDTLAWSQYQVDPADDENSEVYVYDLRASTLTRVTSGPAISTAPRLSPDGANLVWIDDRFGHHLIGLAHQFDLFLWGSLTSGVERRLTTRAGDLQYFAPAGFDGARVLVTEQQQPWIAAPPPARCQPVLYEVSSGRRTELSALAERCDVAAALSGSRAALEYDPAGVSDVVLLDTSTQQRWQVTNHPRRSTRIALDGDWLLWADDRNDQWDLYAMDLSDLAQGDFSPEGLTPP